MQSQLEQLQRENVYINARINKMEIVPVKDTFMYSYCSEIESSTAVYFPLMGVE